MQAKYGGGLVSISDVGCTGQVSVVGSTLTNIAVRAHCSVPAHRGSRPAAPRRGVPHGVWCVYPDYPTGVPPRRLVLTAHWGAAGYPWLGAGASFAWRGVQTINSGGGLVSLSDSWEGSNGGKGNVSIVSSTLTNITVRAHCSVPVHRGSRPAAPRRAVPHGAWCEYPTGVPPRCSVLTAHWGTAGYLWWAPARACGGMWYAGR